MLTLDRYSGKIMHDTFGGIINYLKEGDCLVFNDTRVIPARLYGKKQGSGGKVEFLLLKKLSLNHWEVALKPGRIAKQGAKFVFGDNEVIAEIVDVLETGNRVARFEYTGVFEDVLRRLGEIPLPHYITEKLKDSERYQTVYARHEGSAAAPTAGLHFTNELIDTIKQRGVMTAYLTLHVGLGTFRPVKVDDIVNHHMHSEYYVIDAAAADTINHAKRSGGRIVSVGTTACRVLETVSDQTGFVDPQSGETDIFIYPGYKFKAIDALITNFHLPESTLLMLISAFAGRDNVMAAYEEAVRLNYRFFSFGDAMFIY